MAAQETQFDAKGLTAYLTDETPDDVKIISQFYNEVGSIKRDLAGIFASKDKESKIGEMYKLADALKEKLEKYANMSPTEKYAKAGRPYLNMIHIGIEHIYQTALLSTNSNVSLAKANAETLKEQAGDNEKLAKTLEGAIDSLEKMHGER